jgi:hypothetical protein
MWLSVVGLLSVPLAAHGAVSLVEFQPSTPIVASEVNENFASINASLDGPLVFGDQPIDTPAVGLQAAPFTNAIVGLTTTGGRVHVWLVPRFDPDPAGTESGFAILGAGDTAAAGIIYLERSADGGETWEQRGNIIVSGSGPASYFSPSDVSFMDEAPAGDWTYRLSGRISGPAESLQLLYVELVARELASG